MEIHQKISMPNYQKLKTLVKRSADQTLRLRKFWRPTWENWNRSCGRESKGRKWLCRRVFERRQMQFPALRVTIVRNHQNTKPPHLPSHPFHEVEVCRRKEVSNSKVTMVPFSDNQGTCTRSPCEYWHPPECQFYKTETVCKAGEKCVFPHHKVDEEPNKKPKKSDHFTKKKKRKRWQKCSGSCENCTTIRLRLARLGCVGISKRQTVPVKPDAKSLGTNSSSTVHSVYATSSKYPGKERTIAWTSISQTASSVKSLRYEIWEPISMKRLKDNSDVPATRHGTFAKNMSKLKQKGQSLIMPAASTIKPEEREFVVDFGASMHMVSKKDLNSAELETMRTSRSPTTVTTASGEVQTREEATEDVKELDLFVTVMLLEETPAVLSLGKLCEDHRKTYHWTSGQKPHLTKKGKRIDCI